MRVCQEAIKMYIFGMCFTKKFSGEFIDSHIHPKFTSFLSDIIVHKQFWEYLNINMNYHNSSNNIHDRSRKAQGIDSHSKFVFKFNYINVVMICMELL